MELLRMSKCMARTVMIILIVTAFVCLYKIHNNTVEPTYNAEYALSYSAKMAAGLENAGQVLGYSLFADKNTYFYLNTIKYYNDIQTIIDVDIRPANTIAIEKLMEYSFVPLLFVLIMIFFVNGYLEENHNGMKRIVRATVKGRLNLALKRTGIMAGVTLVVSLVINFVVFGMLLIFYGGALNLLDPIQSSPQFALFPYKISILQFFYWYCVFFAIMMFVVGQIIYLIMQLTNMNKSGYVILILIFALEYILNATIPASSSVCYLKYINLTYVLLPGAALGYENWGTDIFVTDVYRSTTLMALVVLVVMVLINNLVYIYKYESRKSRLVEKFQTILQRMLAKMNVFFMEMYKVLILQFGVVIVAILAVLLNDTKIIRGVDYSGSNYYVQEFMDLYAGTTPGEASDEYINALKQQRKELQEKDEIKGLDRAKLEDLNKAIAILDSTTAYLRCVKFERGIDAKYVQTSAYKDIFGERMYDNQSNINMLCIVAVILTISGIFAYERKSNMMSTITSYSRRNRLTKNKALVTVLMVVSIWLVSMVVNWSNILDVYTLENVEVPIQSLSQFEGFGLRVSIRGYIIFCQLFRLMWLGIVALVVFVISMYFNYESSIALAFLLLVPHMFYMLRFEELEVLSPVVLMDYTRISFEESAAPVINIACFIVCVLIITEMCLIKRRKIRV